MDKLWAVMPAAGSGQRMQSSVPKQYLEIEGTTILQHSLEAMLQLEQLESVVVCVSSDDTLWSKLSNGFSTQLKVRVDQTIGGETRAQSVLNGLAALDGVASDHDWVLVHDAARPCVSLAALNRLVEALANDSVGGILAVPAKDTLKLSRSIGDCGEIDRTLDRSLIWQAQTPQMFRLGLLKSSLERGLNNGADITDEASALELAGHQVKLVQGDSRNIKVTTPDDLALAQFLLQSKRC